MNNEKKQDAAAKKRATGKIVKILLVAFVTVLVLLLAALLIGPALLSTAAVERAISQKTQESLGRPAALGGFSMKLVGGVRVILSDLVIKDKEQYGDRPLLKVDEVTLNADLLALLKNKIVVNSMSIENPEISVVKGKQGQFNLADLAAKEPAKEKPEAEEPLTVDDLPAFKIAGFTLSNGKIYFADLQTGQTSHISGLSAQLEAQAQPSEGLGQITTAKLSCDGFDLSARGKMEHVEGAPVVKDFAVESKADISKLGELMSPILPANFSGAMEYHLAADGPIASLKTESEFSLTRLRVDGARLRKPATIDSFVARQSSVLDLERISARQIVNEVVSDDLGISGKVTGKIANLRDSSGLDLKVVADADLDKLSNFADSFTPHPLKADGQLTADAIIVGDPRRELAAKGQVFVTDLRLDPPGAARPYSEARADLAYDFTLQEGTKLNIKKFTLKSSLITAQASGRLAPEAADLAASAAADLGAASSALAGMGLVSEDLSFEGEFTGNVRARTAEDGVEAQAAGTVKNFALATPQPGQRYTEPEVTFSASGLVGFADDKPDSIKRSQFTLASRLAGVQGTLVADKLATRPSFACDVAVKADLQALGGALAQLGKLEEGTRLAGRLQADVTISTPDRQSPRKGARAPRLKNNSSALLAFGGDDPAALAALGAGAPGQADAPAPAADNIAATGTVTGESIFYNDIKIDKADADIALTDGKFTADGSAELYQGSIAFSEATNLRKDPLGHDVKLKIKRVLLTKELAELFNEVIPLIPLPLGRIEGVFDADARLAAEGAESDKLFATMDGAGTVTMPEDMRVVIPVFARLPALNEYSALEFGSMSSVFTIENGLSSSETTFVAADLTMKLTGTTNLLKRKVPDVEVPGREINYTVSLKGERVGRDLRRLLNEKGELPIAITGTLENPKAKLVIEGIFGPLKHLFK